MYTNMKKVFHRQLKVSGMLLSVSNVIDFGSKMCQSYSPPFMATSLRCLFSTHWVFRYIFHDQSKSGFRDDPLLGRLAEFDHVILSSHIAFYTDQVKAKSTVLEIIQYTPHLITIKYNSRQWNRLLARPSPIMKDSLENNQKMKKPTFVSLFRTGPQFQYSRSCWTICLNCSQRFLLNNLWPIFQDLAKSQDWHSWSSP